MLDKARLHAQYETQVPLDTVKLHIAGHGTVGKTTLAKALQWADDGPIAHPPDHRTHGFNAFVAELPMAGKCTIWDFAGQVEYWVPLGLVVDVSCGVFIVACNLCDAVSVLHEQLRYWLRFITTKALCDGRKPLVAIVATHCGAAPALTAEWRSADALLSQKERDTLTHQVKRLKSIAESDGKRGFLQRKTILRR